MIGTAFRFAVMLGLLVGVGLSGCEAPGNNVQGYRPGDRLPTPAEVAALPPAPNVVNVVAFYTPFQHWHWTQDRSRVRGIIVNAMYLMNPEGRGVFGDGVIRPRLYLLERTERGGQRPVLLREWSFTVEEATPFRSKKPTVLGWGYMLPLNWEELDLTGREIRLIIAFERADGVIVESSKLDTRVPGAKL